MCICYVRLRSVLDVCLTCELISAFVVCCVIVCLFAVFALLDVDEIVGLMFDVCDVSLKGKRVSIRVV